MSLSKHLVAAAALSVLSLGLSLAAPSVSAEELKIGYVNSERVMREAAPAKAAQAKLEAEFSKREAEVNDMGNKLRTAAAERSRRQRDLVEQDRDFKRKQRELQEDLNQRKNEELAAVVERANKVIRQIFEQEKYDLILQEVIFAGPRVDITKKVIDAMNATK
jgi:outer membrane protein